ncbi:hypothetical protein EXIGLDRAFT_840229 [Exidia glandulosa HHB12029]|uniref:Uncharacterized protein n=1 Tax=Exidia glandulosa HHB12029 TaxID=1314781 RepID=A0A165EK11_EXIGL|nr:hypothetical protein EXIGLDRAFT_840229 [Exidia glandulosa HHB12029]
MAQVSTWFNFVYRLMSYQHPLVADARPYIPPISYDDEDDDFVAIYEKPRSSQPLQWTRQTGDRDVDSIDDSVAELQRRIEELQLQKAQLLAERAPVRRVPPEILARVFELGARTDVHFASTVCAVSSLWHSIAMETPAVWANICLGSEWGLGPDAFLRKVQVTLDRSQSSPLLVDVDLYYIDGVERAHALLEAIAPHVSRCYSLAVCVPQPEWMELVVEHFGAHLAPKLEAMALKFRPTTPWGASYAQATIFEGELPALTSLSLEGLPLTILRAGLPALRTLEYKHFEELYTYPQNSASATPLGDLLGLLETSPTLEELKLEHCNFTVEEQDLAFDADRPRVELPMLHSLTCSHIDAGNVTLLMESIHAPNLRRLALRTDSIRQVQDLWWVPKEPLRSVRSLELEGFRLMDGSALIAFLRLLNHMPLLTTLSILSPYSTQVTSQFFDVLAQPTRGGAWLCPRLVDITVAACHGLGGHELLHAARARADVRRVDVRPFKRVLVRNCPSFDASVVDDLREIVRDFNYMPPPTIPAIVPPSPMQWGQPVFFS